LSAALSLGLTPGAASASAGAHRASVAVPPALAALEANLTQLQLSSLKVTVAEGAEGPAAERSKPANGPLGPFGRAARAKTSENFLSATVELSYAEQRGSFEGTVLGLPFSGRLIGTTTYEHEPIIGSLDHGRPWVQSTAKEGPFGNEGLIGSQITAPGAVSGSSPAAFGEVLANLAQARSFTQLPPRTLDEQPATGFVAAIPLAAFGVKGLAGLPPIRKKLKPIVQEQVFFAEDGLPLLVRVKIGFRGRRLAHVALVNAESVVWINQPIAPVVPPPAAETITQAQLEHLGSGGPPHKRKRRSKK
jgi:hypothetical protein